MNPRVKTMRPLAQLARLTAVAAVLLATLPAVASPGVTVKPAVTTHGNVTAHGNGGICFKCAPRDEAGHVAVVKG